MNKIIKHLNEKLSTVLQRNVVSYSPDSFRDISLSLILFSYISSNNKESSETIKNIINDPNSYSGDSLNNIDDSLFSIIHNNSVISSFLTTMNEDKVIHNAILDLWEGYLLDRNIFHLNVFSSTFNHILEYTSTLSHHKVGSSYTPASIVNLLTQLLKPQDGERVYDPVCGTGGLLVSLSTVIRKNNKNHITPYGKEVNKKISDIARMNLYINKLPFEHISTMNCFVPHDVNEPSHFDIIVANPPFSLKNWGEAASHLNTTFKYGIPPKSNGDFAFIQHILSKLNNRGRAGVIVPQGVLFRLGTEANIRKGIIEAGVLETIIQLPANVFAGTAISACILLFNKRKTNKDILLVDSSNEFLSSKPRNILSEDHIEKIVKLASNQNSTKDQTYLASYREIVENEYSLFFSNYFNTEMREGKSVQELFELQITLEKKLEYLQKEFHGFK